MLPTLRNIETGKIVEQVRLKEQVLPADLGPAIVNLQQQMMMASILNEIKHLSQSVEEIHLEMMDDRLAEAEAVWAELQQSVKIQDTQLRNVKVLALQSNATQTRLKLEKNFNRNMLRLANGKLKADQRSQYAKEALNELSIISLMARVECASYYLVGEENAGLFALEQYQTFIKHNKLDHRDTLIKINEYTKRSVIHEINEFLALTEDLKQLTVTPKEQKQLVEETKNG